MKSKRVDPKDLNPNDLRAEAHVDRDWMVNCYPIFVIKMDAKAPTPEEAAEKAETELAELLNRRSSHTLVGGLLDANFAEGFDAALVDELDATGNPTGKSITVSQIKDLAQEHAEVLEGLIDGREDELGEMLKPIVRFLRGHAW